MLQRPCETAILRCLASSLQSVHLPTLGEVEAKTLGWGGHSAPHKQTFAEPGHSDQPVQDPCNCRLFLLDRIKGLSQTSLSLEHLLGVLLLGDQWALATLPDVKVIATRQESMTLKILLSLKIIKISWILLPKIYSLAASRIFQESDFRRKAAHRLQLCLTHIQGDLDVDNFFKHMIDKRIGSIRTELLILFEI